MEYTEIITTYAKLGSLSIVIDFVLYYLGFIKWATFLVLLIVVLPPYPL